MRAVVITIEEGPDLEGKYRMIVQWRTHERNYCYDCGAAREPDSWICGGCGQSYMNMLQSQVFRITKKEMLERWPIAKITDRTG